MPRGNGSIGLAIGSTNLVDGIDARPLVLEVTRGDGGRVIVASITTRGTPLENPGGALGGCIDGVGDVRDTRNRLDSLDRMLTQQVNLIHAEPPLERDFFHVDGGGITAANIRLSDSIRADSANVLAGTAGTDNSIALAMTGLRDLKFTLTNANGDPLLDSQGIPSNNPSAGSTAIS